MLRQSIDREHPLKVQKLIQLITGCKLMGASVLYGSGIEEVSFKERKHFRMPCTTTQNLFYGSVHFQKDSLLGPDGYLSNPS